MMAADASSFDVTTAFAGALGETPARLLNRTGFDSEALKCCRTTTSILISSYGCVQASCILCRRHRGTGCPHSHAHALRVSVHQLPLRRRHRQHHPCWEPAGRRPRAAGVRVDWFLLLSVSHCNTYVQDTAARMCNILQCCSVPASRTVRLATLDNLQQCRLRQQVSADNVSLVAGPPVGDCLRRHWCALTPIRVISVFA